MLGISRWRVSDTPIAVIDFETTGLTAGFDRVVEVSVVRIDPGREPELVFDTLVNPKRPMAATEIHGITDADVKHAPVFEDIVGDIIDASKDCVIASYNVYFDIKFLASELSYAGIDHQPPHLCLMYMRPMLGLGGRCKLVEACEQHGLQYSGQHIAASDAMAAASLWKVYLDEISSKGIETFDDLRRLKKYKFNDSFSSSPFVGSKAFGFSSQKSSVVSRFRQPVTTVDPVRQAMRDYWDLLRYVLGDLEIDEEELRTIIAEQRSGRLKPGQIRGLHAKAFASVLLQFMNDQTIDKIEALKLRKLKRCLRQLGWCPGD